MIKKISVSLLFFASIVFNSYSIHVVRLNTISDLALIPQVIKYIKDSGQKDVVFKNKQKRPNAFQKASIKAINQLTQEEICIFESEETYENNKELALNIVRKWVVKTERGFYEVWEESPRTFNNDLIDMVLSSNLPEDFSEKRVSSEMQKLEGNFKKIQR